MSNYEKMFDVMDQYLTNIDAIEKTDTDALSLNHLKWMIMICKNNIDTWSVSKMNRWIGFIQAGLLMHKLTSMDDLKNLSRMIGT